ncbi:MAG: pantoate--beta-alanine ligase [Saprospiraceae bacterium]|nr:pantoate--beta-alanine ligase [Saprospiraceae bacterium]
MQVFTRIPGLQDHLLSQGDQGHKIAFVPTMGALHAGHLSLIDKAHELADKVVASIFVNPAQFNDVKDLEHYPRPLFQDLKLLEDNQTNTLFLPGTEDIYPPGIDLQVNVDFNQLTQVMEGVYRPGHFEGVIKVVSRLLDIVKPNYLIMGQKDFQQVTIIRHMIEQLKLPVSLVANPIVRESDGLALSSRNVRIDPTLRRGANAIYQCLKEAEKKWRYASPVQVRERGMAHLRDAGFRPEYFAVVDGYSLDRISEWDQHDFIVICVAAWLGNVRLIDNLILQEPASHS